MRLLLEKGANHRLEGNAYHRNPAEAMVQVVKFGFKRVVRILLNDGADLNKSCKRHTLVALAAYHGQADMLQFLLDNGATLQGSDGQAGDKALKYASHNGYVSIVKLLIGLGVNPNGIEEDGWPMRKALICGHTHVVDVLVQHGARRVEA